MSSENEGKQIPEVEEETHKTSKITYTRDFLLSLSDLDVCKELPSGFDQSLLSEFEDASLERQRTSGGLNSFRRSNEYGSSPPTRGDSSSYSRGVHGRWEGRSVRSDKDSDSSQSDFDSDSSRRYGNQSKRSWQVPEHDGLLGSGSFPRPSGYASGASAPKPQPRTNDHYQLNRSTEPYQPPRPYKAVPHSRRDTDAFNDETFGSSEHTSKDRAEEERKRRASFELMRKEHHKSFQEKKFDKNPDDFDISTLVDEPNDKKSVKRSGDSEELVKLPAKSNDPEKPAFPSQTPASRPLVPPGFYSNPVDRSSGPKAFIHSNSAEVGNAQSADNLLQGNTSSTVHTNSDNLEEKKLAQDIGFTKQERESLSSRGPINDQSGKGLDLSSLLNVSNKTAGAGSILYDKTNTTHTLEASKSSEGTEQGARPSILGGSSQEQSGSILDKLFSSSLALSETNSAPVVEHHDSEANNLQAFQSSKFARWFNEEVSEKKQGNDQSSGRPNDLLSLIVGKQGVPRVSGIKSDTNLPNLPFQNSDIVSAPVASFDKLQIENKPQPVSAVLTCEDLEQSMLSEAGVVGSVPQPSVQIPSGKTEPRKANTDNLASRHLLSLLQMSPDSEISSNVDTPFPGNTHSFEEPASMSTVQSSRDAKVRSNAGSTNNSFTLETLFGSAFVKELQSVGAPVSSQRGAAAGSSAFPNSHGSDDAQLPEEDSLIFSADPPPTLESLRTIRPNQDLPFIRGGGGPYDIRDASLTGGNHPYQNSSSQPPAAAFAQLLRPQLGVQFPPMDSRPVNIMNSQMKFMGPGEGAMHHHDPAPPSHQVQMNMARPQFHHQNPGLSGFDQPIPHHLLQQQRHMQGNFSQNLHQGMPGRILPMSAHPNHNAHPNFGGHGMALQGPDVGGGSNHAEALQRLIEMELRPNPNQVQPFGGGGPSRGNLSHELDMGFGFR